MKDYIFTAFVISSGGFVLVTELAQTKPLYALIVGIVCLVYSVDCIVSAFKEYKTNESIRLRPYKIPPNVIKHYDEDYPYLVVAEKPNSTEVEYWWAGDNDINDVIDLQHSRIADKYIDLGLSVIAEPVKGENNG